MKISVAMCTYNGQAFLREQLNSIAAQHRKPDELIIGDDLSIDQTMRLVHEFASQVSFPVSILQNEKRLGPAQNFSQTIQRCTGDVILTCDQDDRWLPEKTAVFEKLFAENPECLLATSNLAIMLQDGTPTPRTFWDDLHFCQAQQQAIGSGTAIRVLLSRNVIVGASMAFRAELAAKALPIPDVYMHDEWLALVASLVGRIQVVASPLGFYRLHKNQTVGSQSGLWEQWQQARKIMTPQYFANRIVRAQALADVAAKYDSQLIEPEIKNLIRGFVVHADSVTKMHRFWLWRLPLLPLELITGRYHQYDYGLKGLARDVLL